MAKSRKFKGIPTEYKGCRFRSRLEARWAAFFDLLEWKWEYEPFDLRGWIPDFVLSGKNDVLVEIKPYIEFNKYTSKKIAVDENETLLLGYTPILDPQTQNILIPCRAAEKYPELIRDTCDFMQYQHICFGYIRTELTEAGKDGWDYADLAKFKNKFDFYSNWVLPGLSEHSRLFGKEINEDENRQYIEIINEYGEEDIDILFDNSDLLKEITEKWNEAGAITQWNPQN